jgi:hypothetical protein
MIGGYADGLLGLDRSIHFSAAPLDHRTLLVAFFLSKCSQAKEISW